MMSYLFLEQLYLANYGFALPEHTAASRRECWSRSRVGGREKLVCGLKKDTVDNPQGG